MTQKPMLLFLHGVGNGEVDAWRSVISGALAGVGYPGLDGIKIIAPKYSAALKDVDDDDPLPGLTIPAPRGEAARQNRQAFERRMGALELILGAHDPGRPRAFDGKLVDVALAFPQFVQAQHYLRSTKIRAQVMHRVLRRLPESGRVVVVAHSLGSVIAADLLRRLPPKLGVVGMVTIGSPLANPQFHVGSLRETLAEPPTNLAWWMNFWSLSDLVTGQRGVSSNFPWMADRRVCTGTDIHAHDAESYLRTEPVAKAIGLAVFGSQSKELILSSHAVEMRLDYAETVALMALRYGYLTMNRLDSEQKERFSQALRQVQGRTMELVAERNGREHRPLPAAIADLRVDLSDPASLAPEPGIVRHLSKEEAIIPLISLASTNVLLPFEITVAKSSLRESIKELTTEMGLGSQLGADALTATEQARNVVTIGGGANWLKWVALGVGVAALIAATGGLALVAAPGAFGAAAITSALAAFGPGGMIGGLLTAGTLVSAGGGGIALGLASPGTAAATVEAVIGTHLAAAILRKLQAQPQDPNTWDTLVETEIALRRELARLQPISDDSAPSLKQLRRKLDATERALEYLVEHGLVPGTTAEPDDAEVSDQSR